MASLSSLFGHPEPDGAADALQDLALSAGQALAVPPSALPRPPHPRSVLVATLGAKVLHAWLQNRHQTRYPLVLNLRDHRPEDVALLRAAVRLALDSADPGEAAAARAQAALARLGAPAAGPAPPPTPDLPTRDLPDRLRAAGLAPQAFAACCATLGRRTLAARRYLDFLAARLGIPDEAARSIARRFGS